MTDHTIDRDPNLENLYDIRMKDGEIIIMTRIPTGQVALMPSQALQLARGLIQLVEYCPIMKEK